MWENYNQLKWPHCCVLLSLQYINEIQFHLALFIYFSGPEDSSGHYKVAKLIQMSNCDYTASDCTCNLSRGPSRGCVGGGGVFLQGKCDKSPP